MSSTVALLQSGLPSVEYYAPNFKVEVEGRELDPQAKGDVLEVKVTMDIDNLTSFDLTINNWDDKSFRFKYSDSQTFDVGNRVHIRMGYADQLRFMASGIISALTPNFPDSGPSTLGVRGIDPMMKLRDRKPLPHETKSWQNKADWQIVREIAERNKLRVSVRDEGLPHPLVVQKNQDDAKFLMERAKRIDYDCYIRIDPDTGLDTLYFQPPTDSRGGGIQRIYNFVWGTSLISFSPQLNIGHQVGKVTVRGWNPRTKEPITYTATADDLPGAKSSGGESGPELAQKRLNDKQDVVVNQPVANLLEARNLALSLLRERAYGFLTGSGHVIGVPDLRPGVNVQLDGLGDRFSGEYYVTKVEHAIGGSGYTTHFEVRRDKDAGAT
jgi:phage protein D